MSRAVTGFRAGSAFKFAFMLGAMFVVLAASFGTGHTASTTVTLSQGADGYTGTTDTTLVDWQPSVNLGSAATIGTARDRRTVGLLRFDLSAIPANSRVESARLELHLDTSDATTAERPVEVHNMLVSWSESEATWNRRRSGTAWSGAGPRPSSAEATGDYAAESAGGTMSGCAGVWLQWDLATLVQDWVRKPASNNGCILLDPNGYEDPPGGGELREYASSENTNATLRPKLTIVYNPDTPSADAGPDRVIRDWDGGLVVLDGSGSHDRPGGNDETLLHEWRVVTAAWGSALTGVVGNSPILDFTPDTAGEWELELTVTNDLGESASDRVHLRLLSIPSAHPRIHLSPGRLTALRADAASGSVEWTRWRDYVASNMDPEPGMWDHYPALQYGLLYQVLKTSDAAAAAHWAQLGVARMEAMLPDCPEETFQHTAYCVLELSHGYDWLYDYPGFSEDLKSRVRAVIEPRVEWTLGEYNSAFHNEHNLNMNVEVAAGLALEGESERAGVWLDHARYARYQELTLPSLNAFKDSGWPEGEQYGHEIVGVLEFVQAWRIGTGENLMASTPYFSGLGRHYLHASSNDWAADWGNPYRLPIMAGDIDTRFVTFHDYSRHIVLMTLPGTAGASDAAAARAYLARAAPGLAKDRMSWNSFSVWDFLWKDAGAGSGTPPAPEPLSFYDEALGFVSARGSWDPDAVWVTFQAGDHFSAHQHMDQGHFSIYRGGWLAMDSGAYDAWCTDHLINYYHQSIAHNTIAVRDPAEPFGEGIGRVCSDGYPRVNTEGQRAFDASPHNVQPPDVASKDRYARVYDTADMTAYEYNASGGFTYARADITNAYSDKISRFEREFLFIRPGWVLTYDRVRVRDASLTPRWLLHMANEPIVDADTVTFTNGHHLDGQEGMNGLGDGRLVVRSVFPAGAVIEKIGGPGRDALVGGENFSPGLSDRQDPGNWRIEISPSEPGLEHRFLNVMAASGAEVTGIPDVEALGDTDFQGVHLHGMVPTRVVLFSVTGAPPSGPVHFTTNGSNSTRHMVFDLAPDGHYRIESARQGASSLVTLTPDPAGAYHADARGLLVFALSSLTSDIDGDGMADAWEQRYFGGLGRDGTGDFDGDGLKDLVEFRNGLDPTKKDTDGDTMNDRWELANGLDPRIDDAGGDADGDGFTNLQEYNAGTDPRSDESVPSAPVADAGPDQEVVVGAEVTLSAANSTDPDRDVAGYLWEQVSGPKVRLLHPRTARAGFTAPAVVPRGATLVFRVTVTDRVGLKDEDTCAVHVVRSNRPPVANAGVDRTVREGRSVLLDGRGSTDPEGALASYAWTQVSGPSVTLTNANRARAGFTAPDVDAGGAALVFRLTVTDAGGLVSTDDCTVNVTWVNAPPVARAGEDQHASVGETVSLDGEESLDPDGVIAGSRWTQVAGPPVTLDEPTELRTTFVVPPGAAGQALRFRLTVVDGGGLQAADGCIVRVEP